MWVKLFIKQVQQAVDYKKVLLKENPFQFRAFINGTTRKGNVTRHEKKFFLHKKDEGYKIITKALTKMEL